METMKIKHATFKDFVKEMEDIGKVTDEQYNEIMRPQQDNEIDLDKVDSRTFNEVHNSITAMIHKEGC